jgi:hypothetical protein
MNRKQVEKELMTVLNLNSPYYKNKEESTLKMVREEDYVKCFRSKAGHELSLKTDKPKFLSVVSSSALAVNAFAPWKQYLNLLQIEIEGNKYGTFEKLRFEEKVYNGLRGTPPHLDVWIESPQIIIAIESKFCEVFDKKHPEFSEQYNKYRSSYNDEFTGSNWLFPLDDITTLQSFKYLDVAQLVKHYFGLKHYAKTHDTKEIVLLYAYWEPKKSSTTYESVYKNHAAELSRFKALIGNDHQVSFYYTSYRNLIENWSRIKDTKVQNHVTAFKNRYLNI